jgi:hypothetical protein
MAYSGSYTFSIDITQNQLLPNDNITFEFISENLPTSKNYTASLGEGSLTVNIIPPLNGAYPYATSSIAYGNFVTGAAAPNQLILNYSLSSFYGSSYYQIPYFESGSGGNISLVTASLYQKYLDINEPFLISSADKIVIRATTGAIQELTVESVITTYSDGLVRINTLEALNSIFITNPENIDTFVLVKKIRDEQNIILNFKKSPGATSYGFLISDDIDPTLIANISTIQTNVQNQLLSTQNTGQSNNSGTDFLGLGTF